MNEAGKKMCVCCENTFENLFSLKSILKITKDSCMEKEFSSVYYDLPPKYVFTLSKERNDYINMLNIAMDKTEVLLELNNALETELQYL